MKSVFIAIVLFSGFALAAPYAGQTKAQIGLQITVIQDQIALAQAQLAIQCSTGVSPQITGLQSQLTAAQAAQTAASN